MNAASNTFLINYIWLRKDKLDKRPIPQKEFAAFQRNAALYIKHNFQLWVEDNDLCACYATPENVKIRFIKELDKKDIQLLDTIEIFEQKIDLLRLIIIRKVLSEQKNITAIYSDFDVLDISLNSEAFKERLDKFGMAFSGSYQPLVVQNTTEYFGIYKKSNTIHFSIVDTHTSVIISEKDITYSAHKKNSAFTSIVYLEYGKVLVNDFENGFLAFQSNNAYLLQQMIQRAENNITSKCTQNDPRDTVYSAMADILDKWAKDKSLTINWRTAIASFYAQYCSGWKLDDIDVLIPEMN